MTPPRVTGDLLAAATFHNNWMNYEKADEILDIDVLSLYVPWYQSIGTPLRESSIDRSICLVLDYTPPVISFLILWLSNLIATVELKFCWSSRSRSSSVSSLYRSSRRSPQGDWKLWNRLEYFNHENINFLRCTRQRLKKRLKILLISMYRESPIYNIWEELVILHCKN